MTFINKAVTFVGKGSLAVKRLFKTAVTFIGRGGSAVGGRGEASGACADGACAGGAGVDRVFDG